MGWDGGKGPQRQLRSSHLGSHRPLTLQLGLVSVKGLLSAVLQIRAVVVLRESMLNEKGRCTSVQAYMTGGNYSPHRRIAHDNVGIRQRCAGLQSCTELQCRSGTGNASWQPWLLVVKTGWALQMG